MGKTSRMTFQESDLPLNSPESDLLPNSSEELNQFLSHELRTSLTSIHGALKILQSGQFEVASDKGKRLLEIALSNTCRLIRLTYAIENQPRSPSELISEVSIARFRMEAELNLALKRQEFQLYYQPIVLIETRQILGFEALIRWRHPNRGWVAPSEFIPVAEEVGLVHAIGLWVLREASHQLKLWQEQFSNPELTVSINLSTLQLSEPRLVEQVQQILQETGVAIPSIRLEITESAFLENSEIAITVLQLLKALGLQLYIDDFGTGYSSLARLQDWPIDVLKIDNSFVRNQKWTIVEVIMLLAKSLAVEVIAEGVETVEALTKLQQLGCKYCQGYLFSKPVAAEIASKLLESSELPKT
ncbi:MAG: EAL domain-containing protein [Microcoleaceae cyanobacterium]